MTPAWIPTTRCAPTAPKASTWSTRASRTAERGRRGAAALLLCAAGLLAGPGLPAAAQEAGADGATRSPTLRERLAAQRGERPAEPAASARRIDGPGSYSFTLQHDGLTRAYRVHVPKGYQPGRPTPVVFAFHGGGGTAEIMATDRFYGLIGKSEQTGAIVVFPNGFSRFPDGRLATFNAGSCCGPARDRKVDDVGFVRALMARLKEQVSIDPARVVATGMSNGAMMSYRLACEASDLFPTIAAVAGTDGMDSCSPARPVSVLHIHARNDDMVLFNGGAGRDSRTLTDFRSVDDTIARWVRLNACTTPSKTVLDLPGQARCEVYGGCKGGVEVKLCVTETGGHSWPGGMKARTGERGSTAISAVDMIWDFASRR